MSIDHFIKALKARWRLAIAVQGAVVLVILIISLVFPKRYTASADVLVDMKAPDPVASTVLTTEPLLAAIVANEVNVLQSERVMLRALVDIKLMDDPELREKWEDETDGVGDYMSWLAARMAKNLDVKASRAGSVLNVQFTAKDRNLAASMANAIVKAYIDTTLALRVDPARQYNQFFDERAKSAREALEQAQSKLSAYQQSRGIIISADRMDVEAARLGELSSQLVALQAVASESSSRRREAGRQVESLPEVISSPLLTELNAALATQETRLLELSSRLKDLHPDVIDQKANIAETKARIKAESQRVVRGLSVSNNVNQSRVGQLNASIEAQRTKLLQLKGKRDEAAVLQRDVESAQRAYDTALTRLNQSGMESQIKQTNVASLKTASPPPKASFPKLPLNMAVALVLGALLAIGAVYLRELTDRRLRTAESMIEWLGQPLLGVLPKSAALEDERSARGRVLAGAPGMLRLESP